MRPEAASEEAENGGELPHELWPAPRRSAARIVGPGRRERAYLSKVAALEGELAARARELELCALVERGATRAADRLETHLERERGARLRDRRSLEAVQKRLILALGALQRENELLREQLALPSARRRTLAAPLASGVQGPLRSVPPRRT